ncbi:MAG: SET domain-containing protein-lysine N-methyltransferase [Burkholderiaceae bacterium]
MVETAAAIYVAETGTPRGKGVFAGRDFKAGELVEVCTVLPYRMSFDKLSHELQHVVFNWSEDDEILPFHAHAMGFGSFYNHANPANMRYETDRIELAMRFYVVGPVARDTELTINYDADDGGPSSEGGYWFEEMGIERL